ncbi:MAG: hypothetical protein LBB94_08070 [Clostridiales bacterium]|jgi:hypothetical protein|nr:hypothetical protein [Clostridiales bacterium]
MSEINFLELESKEPEKTNYRRLLVIVFGVITVTAVAFLTLSKTIELSALKNEKLEKKQFIESVDTQALIKEYGAVQSGIAEIINMNMPITKAYTDYRILNTVTGSLINDCVWAPIKANPDKIEFKSLTVAGNNLTINASVNDIGAMRAYMTDLAGMTVNVDKDNIDKIPGDKMSEGDRSIDRFKDPFAFQITQQADQNFKQPYEGELGILINKDITEDMNKLLGKVR